MVAAFWLGRRSKDMTKEQKELNYWVEDLVQTAMYKDSDYGFSIVEAIHEADANQYQLNEFSAGPLENLLAYQGYKVIERIEKKAKSDKKFAGLLGGVWQNQMQDDIWERVKKVRDTSIWADARD